MLHVNSRKAETITVTSPGHSKGNWHIEGPPQTLASEVHTGLPHLHAFTHTLPSAQSACTPSWPVGARAVLPSSDQTLILLSGVPNLGICTALSFDSSYLTCCVSIISAYMCSFFPVPHMVSSQKIGTVLQSLAGCGHLLIFTCIKLLLTSILHSAKSPFPEPAACHEWVFPSFLQKAERKLSWGTTAHCSFKEDHPFSLWGALFWHLDGGFHLLLDPEQVCKGGIFQFHCQC